MSEERAKQLWDYTHTTDRADAIEQTLRLFAEIRAEERERLLNLIRPKLWEASIRNSDDAIDVVEAAIRRGA